MQLQNALEKKIPKSVVVQHIGVGAGTFCGCEGFLPQISLTCSKKLHKKVTSKKTFPVILGALGDIFAHIFRFCSDFQRLCEGFQRLCPDFHEVCLDFKGFYPDFQF